MDTESVSALAQVAVSELPQLQELHLPITAVPSGGAPLIAALLGATHLRLTLDLYASTAHDFDSDGIRINADHFPEVSNFLAQYAPLFPHLRSVNVFCYSAFPWLRPLAANAGALSQLHALRLTSEQQCYYCDTLEQLVRATRRLSSLRELSLCDLTGPWYRDTHALQHLTRLTSLQVPNLWYVHAGDVGLPPSLEKLTLLHHHTDYADVHVSSLAPLFLKTLVAVTHCEHAHSLQQLAQGLPHLRDVAVPRMYGCPYREMKERSLLAQLPWRQSVDYPGACHLL